MREEKNTHGVRGGSPPKGGEPHHPHGGFAHGGQLALIETSELIDGEPVFALAWAEDQGGPHDTQCLSDLDRCVPCTTLNRNIDGPSTVTPEGEK